MTAAVSGPARRRGHAPKDAAGTERRFQYRAGVRFAGTTVACDPVRSANEVVFLSHAPSAAEPWARQLLSGRHAGQQVLLTERTLARLGANGRALRALVCDYGRPFALGELRLELVPSGYAPGAAALQCRRGDSCVVYTGPLRLGDAAPGARETEVRPAEAVCIDATFGAPAFAFPPPGQARALAVDFARDALSSGKTPVLLLDDDTVALELTVALAAAGLPARAHPQLATAVNDSRTAGVAAPALPRLAPRPTPACVAVLWPLRAHRAAGLRALAPITTALVSGFALDDEVRTRVAADENVALSGRAGEPDLLAYVRATGAREIATVGHHAERLATTLREQGYFAYSLGPPRQIPLFASSPA